jgi:hypothetical protein
MSVKVMSLVWDNFKRGGSEKLAMLALADWCNDEGGSLHPSISGVAKKINVSESQARRIIHSFIDDGYLSVVANHGGGNPGQPRHYKLNIDMLLTPCTDATPSVSATPCMDAHDPLHGCALPLAPMTPEPSLTIIKPSVIEKAEKIVSIKKPSEKKKQTFFPEDFAVTPEMFDWAVEQGLKPASIKPTTLHFKDHHESRGNKFVDWNAAWRTWMRNSVGRFAEQRR